MKLGDVLEYVHDKNYLIYSPYITSHYTLFAYRIMFVHHFREHYSLPNLCLPFPRAFGILNRYQLGLLVDFQVVEQLGHDLA